jgi:hypothetical protein
VEVLGEQQQVLVQEQQLLVRVLVRPLVRVRVRVRVRVQQL